MLSQKPVTSAAATEISAMPSPTSRNYSSSTALNFVCTAPQSCTKWQDCLAAFCKEHGIGEPSYQDFSDRRGGRTAWTSQVTIQIPPLVVINARFFYDAAYINNAREDAAEFALQHLQVILSLASVCQPSCCHRSSDR